MSTNSMNTRDGEKKAAQLLSERGDALRPVWVRAPKSGQTEHYSGLGRGKMYQLEALGLVKTASLKPRGAVRGVKLFSLQSLLDYVESCATRSQGTNGRSNANRNTAATTTGAAPQSTP